MYNLPHTTDKLRNTLHLLSNTVAHPMMATVCSRNMQEENQILFNYLEINLFVSLRYVTAEA
jgi:hypothetical protein